GHNIIGIEADKNACAKLHKSRPDLVFNIAEGLYGSFRESYIPTLCEKLGIPYTGSDPLTLGLCLDKARCKEILLFNGIRTPRFVLVESHRDMREIQKLNFPVIVKPNAEGSSKGIFNNSVARTFKEASKIISEKTCQYKQPVIIEELLTGREFTVACLGNVKSLQILPIIEIDHSELPKNAWPIYSYEAKWIWDTPEKPLDIFKCPAKISAKLKKKIENIVKKTFAVMKIRDWCRMDIRLDSDGEPNILEINPLPGILPNPEDNSCFPKAARTAGYSYSQMIGKVIEAACIRQNL
ncbi:MAG: ATP-grasp domain-containing protein, partial [Candidatus Nanoarchaeia archaeon]